MKNFAALIVSILAVLAGLELHLTVLAAVGLTAAVIFLAIALEDNLNATAARYEEIAQADSQLRRELIEAQKLALSRLVDADDELKGKVVRVLVEAGKHLGKACVNNRRSYSSQHFVNWNREGLALVAQARQLIDCAPGILGAYRPEA